LAKPAGVRQCTRSQDAHGATAVQIKFIHCRTAPWAWQRLPAYADKAPATGTGATLDPTNLLWCYIDAPGVCQLKFDPAFDASAAEVGVWHALARGPGLNRLPMKAGEMAGEELS
jgi:hypothetical protein